MLRTLALYQQSRSPIFILEERNRLDSMFIGKKLSVTLHTLLGTTSALVLFTGIYRIIKEQGIPFVISAYPFKLTKQCLWFCNLLKLNKLFLLLN